VQTYATKGLRGCDRLTGMASGDTQDLRRTIISKSRNAFTMANLWCNSN